MSRDLQKEVGVINAARGASLGAHHSVRQTLFTIRASAKALRCGMNPAGSRAAGRNIGAHDRLSGTGAVLIFVRGAEARASELMRHVGSFRESCDSLRAARIRTHSRHVNALDRRDARMD